MLAVVVLLEASIAVAIKRFHAAGERAGLALWTGLGPRRGAGVALWTRLCPRRVAGVALWTGLGPRSLNHEKQQMTTITMAIASASASAPASASASAAAATPASASACASASWPSKSQLKKKQIESHTTQVTARKPRSGRYSRCPGHRNKTNATTGTAQVTTQKNQCHYSKRPGRN